MVTRPLKPDFVVTALRPNRTELHSGDRLGFHVTVKNVGLARAEHDSRVRYEVKLNNQWKTWDDDKIDNLRVGESENLGIDDLESRHALQGNPGTYAIRACVDKRQLDKRQPEEDDTNNCRSSSVRIVARPKPDLVVSSLTPNRVELHSGDRLGFHVTVKNQGKARVSKNTRVRYQVRIGSTWKEWDSDQIDKLHAGKSESLGIGTLSSRHALTGVVGTYQIRACIDKNLPEESHANNCRSSSVRVVARPKPDLIVSAMTLTGGRSHYWTSDFLDMNITVKNIGARKSDDTRVALYYQSGSTWKAYGESSQKVDDLNSNESDTNRLPRERIYRVPLTNRNFSVRACVDYRNDVDEGTEGEKNNCKTVRIAAKQKGNSSIPYLGFSNNGPIIGANCYSVNEPSDPHTWSDNYFCSRWNYKMRWSHAGKVSGMNCTQIAESAEKSYWTPVGMNREMTAASVKAGISAYSFSEFHHGNNAIKMASVPEEALPPLTPDLSDVVITSRQARMLRLSQVALNQLPKVSEPLALFLAGPEPRPDGPLPMRSKFLQHLKIQTEVEFDIENSQVFPMGRAAGFYALENAFNYLESSGKQYVLVGGVDTCKDVMNLSYLANENRIQTEVGKADAFVPGEGACFLLLTSDQKFSKERQINRPGISEEPGHRYTEEPYQGDGLSSAFSKSIALSGATNIQSIYSSFNGESFGAKEYGVAVTRNSSAFSVDCQHMHPGDCFGDLGAAVSVVLLALYADSSSVPALCYSSSDDEFRGVACVV